MDANAAQALIRFGLGRRASEPLPADPAAWLGGQLDGPDPGRLNPGPRTADGLAALRADRETKPPPEASQSRPIFRADAAAELATALTTPAPFRERLVWFWTNHFTVSVRRGECAPLIGAFVEEAIRPHVTGRFQDMLLAVMRHPAMLLYLDNAQSIGPQSAAGRRTGRGLNENLARECLELHTVTPASGYTQADVTSFAAVLTGWSVELKADPQGYVFRPNAHEPGEQTVMGRSFPEGEAGGEAALAFLGTHPSTYRSLATKLARHFVADDPPAPAVGRIEAALHDSGGDLGAAARAMTRIPAAWTPQTKLRAPMDFVVAAVRALDFLPRSVRTCSASSAVSASRCGRRRCRMAGRTGRRTGPAPTRCCAVSTGRTAFPAARPGWTRRRWPRRRSAVSSRTTCCWRSATQGRGRTGSRCFSHPPNSRGADHDRPHPAQRPPRPYRRV